MASNFTCPNCLNGELKVFHDVHRVPVHSVLLMPSRDIAMQYPKGDIKLGYCGNCGFVSNTAFNPTVHEYSTQYEETQGFSSTFRAFHSRLAASLIEKYDLRDKTVVEIGCGKGEFLTLLCEMGGNHGIGFDPAFVKERNPAPVGLDIEFVQDFYSDKYSDVQADFFCCKMTLEHIPDTANFIRIVRRAIGDKPNATVFFQVPDLIRVLKDLAFWDIYYEHCSYFCAGSLARVFREAGFEVLETWTDYDDQYLMITAKPCSEILSITDLERDAPAVVAAAISTFLPQQATRVDHWKQQLTELRRTGGRAVVWGSGSKGVAFLTMLNLNEAIEYVVDINPYRQGKFMAGTGQQIVAPEFLKEYKPDLAIAMNPVYQPEIQQELNRLGLATRVCAV
jgi:2-polyprenyl-3-methyl-5-hydroxy-6-metoxy-1,4-benzoquinol methylase